MQKINTVKKVIYVVKEALHVYPPCITQILMLNDLGVKVTVICGDCDINTINLFRTKNIKCIVVGNKRLKPRLVGKINSYLMFRYNAWNAIKENIDNKTILWFGTVDGVISLEGKFNNIPYILNVLELYDQNSFYRNALKRTIGDSLAVIACEETRAQIMKSWWNLPKIPYVMPNKPYMHPRKRNQNPTTDELENAISKIKNKKVILYQGMIAADRDLGILAEALNEMNTDYTLVLIGRAFNNSVSNIKAIYQNTIYLGYFPAPLHLQITSYAYLGIANYDDSSLNNLFCAPNKIYEYSGFGIPVLGSNVPGLKNTIGTYCAGKCVDFTDRTAIIEAIDEIESNYERLSLNAKYFYDNTDNNIIMKNIVQSI